MYSPPCSVNSSTHHVGMFCSSVSGDVCVEGNAPSSWWKVMTVPVTIVRFCCPLLDTTGQQTSLSSVLGFVPWKIQSHWKTTNFFIEDKQLNYRSRELPGSITHKRNIVREQTTPLSHRGNAVTPSLFESRLLWAAWTVCAGSSEQSRGTVTKKDTPNQQAHSVTSPLCSVVPQKSAHTPEASCWIYRSTQVGKRGFYIILGKFYWKK